MKSFSQFISERKDSFFIVSFDGVLDNKLVSAKDAKDAVSKSKMKELGIELKYKPNGIVHGDVKNYKDTSGKILKTLDFEDLLFKFRNNHPKAGNMRVGHEMKPGEIKKIWKQISTKTKHRIKIARFIEEKNFDEMFDLFLIMEADNTFEKLGVNPIQATIIFNWVNKNLLSKR